MLDADDGQTELLADDVVAISGWRVMGATLMPSEGKAWPEVELVLEETAS